MLYTIKKKNPELKAIQFDGTYSCLEYMKNIFGWYFYSSYSANKETNIVSELRVLCQDESFKYLRKGDYLLLLTGGLFDVIGKDRFDIEFEIIKTK